MQEVFKWNFETSVALYDAIEGLIKMGYKIDSISHCERKTGSINSLSCIVIATKK